MEHAIDIKDDDRSAEVLTLSLGHREPLQYCNQLLAARCRGWRRAVAVPLVDKGHQLLAYLHIMIMDIAGWSWCITTTTTTLIPCPTLSPCPTLICPTLTVKLLKLQVDGASGGSQVHRVPATQGRGAGAHG